MEQKKNRKKKIESYSNENNSKIILNKKTNRSNNQINTYIQKNNNNRGKWTEDEQNKFIEGIVLHGTDWKKVQNLIKTRSEVQIRTYSQNFVRKIKLIKDEELRLDFTLNSICGIKDIIFEIKKKNQNYNIINVLKYLCNKYIISTKNKKVFVNKNFLETCRINEANIYNDRQDNNNSNYNDELKKTIIFNNINIINNNIIDNPSKEFIILQYLLIVININRQINYLLMSIIINILLLNNSTFSNNCNKDKNNSNNNNLILFLLILIYIYQIHNNKINMPLKQRN